MNARVRAAVALVGLGLVGFAGLVAALPVRPAPALQNPPCTEPPEDDASALISITEPAGSQGLATGPVPLVVALTIEQGVLSYPADLLVTEMRWGDGATSGIVSRPCGAEDEYEFTSQTLRHTYAQPGQYTVTWHFDIAGYGPLDLPLVFVLAEAGATATPVPPTTTPVPPTAATSPIPQPGAPTPTLPAGATVAPGGSPLPGATASPSAASSPSATPSAASSPSATPRAGTATTSPTATPTETGGLLATPGTSSGSTGDGESRPEGEPEIVAAIESPSDISTDPAVIATNIVIAGMTVWVFFSSVLLNQVLADRREAVERRFARFTRGVGRLRRGLFNGGRGGRGHHALEVVAVLVLTGGAYSFLEPGLKFGEATAVLLVAAIVGSAGVTYACDGLEALATRRWTGTPAGVRAYPLAVGVAVTSVLVSRALNLTPGIMYGFVASCTVLVPAQFDERAEGRLASVPVVAGLVLAVGAWFAVGPLRGLESDSFLVLAAEATLVVIFIEGIEGLAVAMIPLGVTDGGKVFRWNRWLWAGLLLVAAFVAWHILLGRERQYFSGLREAQSLTVLALFAGYSVLSIGLGAGVRKAD